MVQNERGMALLSVMIIVFILSLIGGLIIYLAGQDEGFSRVRYRGTQAFYVAEGGAWASRAALLALLGIQPQETIRLAEDAIGRLPTTLSCLAPDGLLNLVLFGILGLPVDLGSLVGHLSRLLANPLDLSVTPTLWLATNWSCPLKLEVRGVGLAAGNCHPDLTGFPLNPLPGPDYRIGTYRACIGLRVIDLKVNSLDLLRGTASVRLKLQYTICSDGQVFTYRRRVILQGNPVRDIIGSGVEVSTDIRALPPEISAAARAGEVPPEWREAEPR
jgi:hypothetical protein